MFELLGDFQYYKESKKLEKNQQSFDFNMAPLLNTTEVPADLKIKKK